MGLLLAEGVLRVLPEGTGAAPPLLRGELTAPGDHPVRTPEYQVSVHVNADGFADREWGPEAGPRVVVIGDSFVQAAQVTLDQGFGRVLDAALPGAEVLSMGVPGAGTATALGVLTAHALPRQPDVVLLGFLPANDVLNAHPLLDGKDDKPYYALRDGVLVPTDATELVLRPSPSALARRIQRVSAARRIAAERLALGGGTPIELRVHDPGCPSETCAAWADAWAVTDALIAEMARRCDDAGVRFGVVLFPDAVVATRAGRDDAARRWPEAAAWDTALAWGRARGVAEAHGPTLDLLAAFQAADDGGAPLFYAKDGHWTPRGHRVAAEAAVPFVEGLLSGGP